MDWDAATASVRRIVTHTFPSPLTFTAPGGAPVNTTPAGEQLVGVFRSGSRVISALTQETILEYPNVFVNLADLPELPIEGSLFDIRGRVFRVKEDPQLDGEGGAILELTEVK